MASRSEDVRRFQMLATDFDPSVRIHEWEFPRLKIEDCNVGHGSGFERADFALPPQEMRGDLRCPTDYFDQRHPQMEKLVHRRYQVEHRAVEVIVVDVAADEIGKHALFHQASGDAKIKA